MSYADYIRKQVAENRRERKREFMRQYVLNRAMGHSGGLEGKAAAAEAEDAWNAIIEACE